MRLLKGEKAEELRGLQHTPTYNLNWDVLRDKGVDVNSMPSNINIANAGLKDRNPVLYRTYLMTSILLFVAALVGSIIIISYYSRKARRNERRLRDYANDMQQQVAERTDEQG